jgi:ppGpp synthetase/RelA/SpoT-type nucleotidyltranferase
MKVDKVWLKEQISQYRTEYPIYKSYAEELRRVLEHACKNLAPMAIVQVRAKSLSSFAQKIIRKADKYPDPVRHFTDLCGARVITVTQEEADRVCRFIREHFRIDEANSEDARSRLRTGEFGYLSVHYIVQLRPDRLPGVDLPPEIGDRKAEIQVRTLLQHAWSTMAHDRFYKSEFPVPGFLQRDMARVAALLEEGDGEFARVLGNLARYEMNYGVHMSPERRQEELERWISILENEPEEENKPEEALQVARLARISGDWDTIIRRLTPFAGREGGRNTPALLLDLGYALCRANRDRKKGADYKKGQALLEKVARPEEIELDDPSLAPVERDETRARALYALAWSYQDIAGQEKKALELYHKAYRCEPGNPYHLASFLEFEIHCRRNRKFVALLRPALLKAVENCRAHADAGIELPWAFLTMGRFFLLIGQPFDSLLAYAKAIHLALSGKVCVPEDLFEDEIDFIRRINLGESIPLEEEWVRDLLLLAQALKSPNGLAMEEIRRRATPGKSFREPVVIVAGGADLAVQKEMEGYKECLEKTFHGYRGTIISGGTTAGIPGIVGGLAGRFRAGRKRSCDVIAYLPKSIPVHAKKDQRYHELIVTEGNDFTPQQPLQNWIDFLASGVKPSAVNMLGINGGRIAAFEFRLALALGATVGIVESSGRAASDLLPDADWWNVPNLLVLPDDPMSIRAFVRLGTVAPAPEPLEKMARAIHEKFLDENRWKKVDPVMMPWDQLREDLRLSNLLHAAYIPEILGAAGFGIRPAKGRKIRAPMFEDSDVETMAEMEHGRWNVERLRSGWKYGPVKDSEKRISPYLRPWAELNETVREWDRETVRNYPAVLALVGMEIVDQKEKGSK